MANQRPAENVTSRYDDFLFAPVWDESGGMRLSVLSALARMNFDPWDEAARLATLPAPDAERALASTLDLLPGRPQASPETGILGARLVALLPKAGAATTAKLATITADQERMTNYWFLWLCIAIAMSFLFAFRPPTKAGAVVSPPPSSAALPMEGRSTGPASSGGNSRADPGMSARAPTPR